MNMKDDDSMEYKTAKIAALKAKMGTGMSAEFSMACF